MSINKGIMKKLFLLSGLLLSISMLFAVEVCSKTVATGERFPQRVNIKSDLKVLYVGGSPDIKNFLVKVDSAVVQRSVEERMASFEKMLKHYFKTVKVVDAKDYVPEMSSEYDVTVMDGEPRALVPARDETDAQGRLIRRVKARFLPYDFDRPMMFIAETADILGQQIGLKTDWFCLCLDAEALSFRAEHPIFHGPFAVEMTVKMKPTPPDAYHYEYYSDSPLPDSVPMWRVQTKGYKTDDGFRSGLVSRPWGFADSPDAEYISSGVNAKTIDALAIGRHGNFLLWGFAASPKYLTEEAKAVFANTIVYISKFAGQTPIARKDEDGAVTRDYIKEQKYFATREAWQYYLDKEHEYDLQMKAEQKKAIEKQAKGEKLTEDENMYLKYKTLVLRSYEENLKYWQHGLFEKLGTDGQAYQEYYDSNYDYFYGGEGAYRFDVDEDVKSWGIPNNELRLLEKAIGMWEQGLEVEKAKRVLNRYTLCRFETLQEWRAWFETYKDKLFFTESGGWLFMVNTRDKSVPGNDYSVRELKPVEKKEKPLTDDKNPVRVVMEMEDAGNGNKVVIVRMNIHPGYHTYAQVASTDPYVATRLELVLPGGWEKVNELQFPPFKRFNEAGTSVYEDEAVFRQKIKGTGAGMVQCTLNYQCCDAHICFPPAELEMSVSVE